MAASRSRALLSRVLVALACLVLPLALVSVWVSAVVTDTDRYVATVAPLADNAVVRDEVEQRFETRIMSSLDVQGLIKQLSTLVRNDRLNGWLAAHQDELGDGVRNAVKAAVRRAVVGVVESDQFRPAWEAANRDAHEQLIAALEGDAGRTDGDGGMSIALGTLLNAVLGVLVDDGLLPAGRVPHLEASFPVLDAHQLDQAQRAYGLVRSLGVALPVAFGLLAVTALAVAPVRRRALGWLGGGALLAAGLLAVALLLARSQLTGALGADNEALAGAVWDVLTRSLLVAAGVTAATGLVVLLVAWLAGRLARRPEAQPSA
ncbi:MAG: hypothetical protein U0R78_10980 [Nocardioidaceae bacterium]